MSNRIAENLDRIRERMAAAAAETGRKAEDVALVVVSKYRTVEELTAAIEAGAAHIGENRVQEAEKKRSAIPGDVTFRLIGHLQSNKAKQAVEIFDAIDSLDSVKLAQKLSEELVKAGKVMPVLVQVNSSGEETKFGLEPEEAEETVSEIEKLEGIDVKGLMTIGPFTDDEKEIVKAFENTRMLFEKLRKGREGFDVLSMGMTDDFEIAIKEGSTMIRVGRAIF